MKCLMGAGVLVLALIGAPLAASAGALSPAALPLVLHGGKLALSHEGLTEVAVRRRYKRRYRRHYRRGPRHYGRPLRFRYGFHGCRYRYSGYFTGYPCWSRRVLAPPRYR